MTSRGRLVALLDTLLPGDGVDWPAAGAHGLASRTEALAGEAPGGDAALAAVLEALPTGFPGMGQDAREVALAEIEATAPSQFAATVTAAYSAYYTDPRIRDVIERLTGYENRPPQPDGYALEPFDESLLDAVRAGGPIWRDPGAP